MKPQTRLASARMIDQTPMPWRVTATTAMAAAMKIKVATIERGDSRAMPQTPWPDVQPLLNLVPKPTSKPATATTMRLGGMFGNRDRDSRARRRRTAPRSGRR